MRRRIPPDSRPRDRRAPTRRLVGAALALATLAHVVAPGAAEAQQRDPDFLFKRPVVTLGLNVGWTMPRASSDLFDDFVTRDLTIDGSDFAAPVFAGEIAIRATERLDVAFEVGFSESETTSEYRDWIGEDDLPIAQVTTFRRVPFSVNVKAYLQDRGRSVSRFAWVPAAWSPWVSAGVGGTWYEFAQDGEFIDFETLDIFRDVIQSSGTGFMFQLTGGADVSVGRRAVLTGQLRYSWADAPLEPNAYQGFEPIDLAGFQASAGIKVRL